MNKNKLFMALLAAGVLGATAFGFYTLGRQQAAPQASGMPSANGGQSTGDKKVLYWHDPMVPAQKFDKPGKSPFMDMQLVPVYADGGDDDGKVSISPRVQQNLGIRTAEVVQGSLASALTAVGSVAYNERDVALVQARSNGFVEKLHIRAPLDAVKKGQVLAELYVPDWIAAQEEYLAVRRMQAGGMDAVLDGARQRMRLAGMSDEQIRLVVSSGKLHARVSISAPANGVVVELAAREGMSVAMGAPLFRINGMDTVWINAEVPESAAAQVRPGDVVEARTPSLPGTIFKGKVGALLPQVSAATRTLVARMELANPGGRLLPGMFATVSFNPAAAKAVLLVPTEAVIQTGTRSVVMLAQANSSFQPADVEIGAEANGQTEIRKGLEAGQKVVVSGQFLIDSEASLRGTSSRMGSSMGESAAPGNDPASGKVPAKTHHGEGKVEKIGKDDITISHGPIPSLQWGPMTMGFKLPANGLPRNVEVGDSVIFDIQPAQGGMFQIASITPTVKPANAGAKP